MTCNVCGDNYTSPSLGGPGVCPRCDCGIKPDGTKLTAREALKIAERYKLGQTPYLQPSEPLKRERIYSMGDRITSIHPCPNCGETMETYDASSSLIWDSHCDKCGWDDRLNYYEEKDGFTIHKLTYEQAEAMKDKLYQKPHGPKADTQVNDLANKYLEATDE